MRVKLGLDDVAGVSHASPTQEHLEQQRGEEGDGHHGDGVQKRHGVVH